MSARAALLGVIACLVMTGGHKAVEAQAADVVANPGPLSASLISGTAKIGGLEVPLALPSSLRGSTDSGGNILIPSAGVNFAPIVKSANGINATVRIQATHPVSGQLDPGTGQAALRLRFRLKVETPPGAIDLGSGCYVGTANRPIDINRASTQAPGGIRYGAESGTVAVANASFTVPAAVNCGSFTSNINSGLGLPSGSGNNSIKLTFRISPLPRAGGGTISGGIAEREEGPGLPPDAVLSDSPLSEGASFSSGSSGSSTSGEVGENVGLTDIEFSSLDAFFEDDLVLFYVGCSGPETAVCTGKVRLTLPNKKKRLVGARKYRINAGEVSVVSVTAKLARRSIRKARPIKLVGSLYPVGSREVVRKRLRVEF